METADKNAPANQVCTHPRTLERNFSIQGTLITQRMCTRCHQVLCAFTSNPAPDPTEDAQYPAYWDSAPDMQDLRGPQSFRTLALSLIGMALVLVALTIGLA